MAKKDPLTDLDALLGDPALTAEPEDDVTSLDDILDGNVATPPEPQEAYDDAKDRRLAELEAQVSAQTPWEEPEEEPDPRDARIAELEARLEAMKRGVPQKESPVYQAEDDKNKILIHFLEDGFSACGQIWYRGQEVEFEIGSLAYEQQKDRNGNSWLDLVDDPAAQYRRWGKQFFARGPWPFEPWDSSVDGLTEEEKEDLRKAAEAEKRRGRKAPTFH